MALHKIRKGLDLPIQGAPEQSIEDAAAVTHVALMNDDSPFMKPRMSVVVGDKVKLGQILFEDRKTEGVRYTAPAAGEVVAINRGDRRKLESLVIKVDSEEESTAFEHYKGAEVDSLTGQQVRDLLQESGLWTALRQRPFSKIPSPTQECRSIFVTACDSNALAPDPDVVLKGHEEDLKAGVKALCKLTEGKVFFCRRAGSNLDPGQGAQVQVEDFAGPHPSGLAGTHIHMLDPVSSAKVVWYIGYQDVVAIGKLLSTGKLWTERVVAVAGPAASKPRLLRTRLGASIDQVVTGQLKDGEVRTISGSVLSGRTASGEVFGYLGRYHNQVSCLHEDADRVFLGWLSPGMGKFSTVRAFLSSVFGGGKKYAMTTTTHGSHRAMVPIGMFERVMPLDIMPTFLLRAILSGDIEESEKLGVLELDEEDLGPCSFVSPGKEDYGKHLRELLTTIWKEG